MARCSADAQRAAGSSDFGHSGGDPPFGGLIPGTVGADGANTRGPGAPEAARAAAPPPVFRLPRGAMNYSIRNLVIAGGLAIVAIVAVLIYTSNVQTAAKEGQARVKVFVARVDVPAGTPAKDILARGDLIQKEVVQDDQLPGVADLDRRPRRQGPQAGSLHRPAGRQRRLRPAERGRHHHRDPRHDARRQRRRQGLQRPRRHAQGRRPRRRLRPHRHRQRRASSRRC